MSDSTIIKTINHGNGVTEEHYDEKIVVWKKDGLVHRDGDEPAYIGKNGDKSWKKHAKEHRIGKPAIINADGSEEWCENGIYHRIGGPAILRADGSKDWFKYGNRHRDDGPAVIHEDGTEEWWIDDKELSKAQIVEIIKNKLEKDLPIKSVREKSGKTKV